MITSIKLRFAAVALAAGAFAPTQAADITGAGASFILPVMTRWAADYNEATGTRINYQSIGSGGGIAQIKGATVDFGSTDAPLKPEELAAAGLGQVPSAIGGVVPVINVPGIETGKMRLTGPVLADIFLGKLKTWNDPAIAALNEGADVIVKVDGDGQMNPALIPHFITPILKGQADYTKGNRFYELSHIGQMPTIRLFGNAALSFMAKLSTGYWNLFDTTNGYTAIHAKAAKRIAFDKVSPRYFFETDLLFRLNTIRAVVVDIAMDASYGSEKSNLRISDVAGEFLVKHLKNFGKRIFYSYFLRDMTVASLELVLGLSAVTFGVIFGGIHWFYSVATGMPTPLGTIMLAALPTMLGLQLLLAFIAFDVANVPRRPIHVDLAD